MEGEEDDDLYDPADINPGSEPAANGEVKMELEEGEEEDEGAEESDDDINFITDAKIESRPEAPQVKRQVSSSIPPQLAQPTDIRARTATPLSNVKQEASGDRQPGTPDRPGTDYPARHTSTVDPNANPVHPLTGKPILSTDFDTDFPSESTKPWRKPGSDITDYFNYGFDEFTWASYCLKTQQMPKEITEIKNQAESMKAFVEGIGSGGLPGMAPSAPSAPAGMPQMPGMPSEAEMQQMFAGMMAQGMNPASMDPNQFMQMMMGGGPGNGGFGGQDGGFGGQPAQQPQGGYGGGGSGFNQQGGGQGFRSRGQRGRW